MKNTPKNTVKKPAYFFRRFPHYKIPHKVKDKQRQLFKTLPIKPLQNHTQTNSKKHKNHKKYFKNTAENTVK